MRYKVLAIVVILLLLVSALIAPTVADDTGFRAQQHIQAKPTADCGHADGAFCTHLPVIMIDKGGQELTFETVRLEGGLSEIVPNTVRGTVTVIHEPGRNSHLDDAPALMTDAEIRYRGHSSIRHDKHNYKLSFLHSDGTENKDEGLLGMEPYDEWALHGPMMDRTLLRNYVCMNIIGQVMEYTPDVRFCELFVDGEYQGLYVAMETVARSQGRVNIAAYDENDPVASYIVKADWYTDSDSVIDNFTTYAMRMAYSTALDVVYPGEKRNPAITKYIEDDFSKFEKTLYSFDYDDPNLGYRRYTDVDSFVDYAIFNEFFQNYDAGALSTYFYKDVRGKICMGPVWDFNNCCNNFKEEVTADRQFDTLQATRFDMLIKDEYFTDKLISRYRQLRRTVLNEAYLLDYIDDVIEYLGPAIARDNARWHDLVYVPETMDSAINLRPESRNPKSYEASVEQLKTCLINRGAWLDAHIEDIRQYSHESAVKKYNP